MGTETDAIKNGQRNTLRKFKSRAKSFLPYTLIGEVLAAESCWMLFPRFLSAVDAGRTLTSDPVSIRNEVFVDLSLINKRRDAKFCEKVVAFTSRWIRFLSKCKEDYTFGPCPEIAGGTSTRLPLGDGKRNACVNGF
ncbi:hypothetical protein AVEN_40044-1 [Araneus ventricosus]|uniref:Uncharacterized protein n=1 Tax=Araneus ventricosus TaxID=182803 RepID=A0A4Y2NXJ4_ARAVE|nr:hypothetical protein AVEN_40044-1 [Araneus ventricosus]